MFGKNYSWVCAICGQGLTRRSSAIRHSNNLHLGGGNIVRPYEYIIGRLKGEFPTPTDPLLYRRKKKQYRQFSHKNSGINNVDFYGRSVTHETSDPLINRNVERITNNNNHKTSDYDPEPKIRQESYKVNYVQQSDPFVGSKRTFSSKFEEIKGLWRQHFSSEVPDNILRSIAARVIDDGGNESFLDEFLVELHKKTMYWRPLNIFSPNDKQQKGNNS